MKLYWVNRIPLRLDLLSHPEPERRVCQLAKKARKLLQLKACRPGSRNYYFLAEVIHLYSLIFPNITVSIIPS